MNRKVNKGYFWKVLIKYKKKYLYQNKKNMISNEKRKDVRGYCKHDGSWDILIQVTRCL